MPKRQKPSMSWLDEEENEQDRKTWFAGVPIATNPLILMDLVRFLIILWVVVFLMLVAAQHYLGDGLDEPRVFAAIWLATYLAGSFAAAFFALAFLAFRNVFIVYCRLTPYTIVYETLRGRIASRRPFFSFRPYKLPPPQTTRARIRREVSWKDIHSCQLLPEIYTIILKGKGTPPLRLYCPDSAGYDTALAYIQKRLAR